MYTRPNFPFPRGRPMSNEDRCHSRVGRLNASHMLDEAHCAMGQKGAYLEVDESKHRTSAASAEMTTS